MLKHNSRLLLMELIKTSTFPISHWTAPTMLKCQCKTLTWLPTKPIPSWCGSNLQVVTGALSSLMLFKFLEAFLVILHNRIVSYVLVQVKVTNSKSVQLGSVKTNGLISLLREVQPLDLTCCLRTTRVLLALTLLHTSPYNKCHLGGKLTSVVMATMDLLVVSGSLYTTLYMSPQMPLLIIKTNISIGISNSRPTIDSYKLDSCQMRFMVSLERLFQHQRPLLSPLL
jgi:hypothetical protein